LIFSRRALSVEAETAFGLVASKRRRMSERFVLAQISDMHIRSGPRDDGFDPSADLSRALARIREFGADAIVATGDLANDAQADEYRVLAALLADAPAPLFLLPGNHDDPSLMREVFPGHRYWPGEGPLSYVIDDFPVRLVAIDQIVFGETHGDFTLDHGRWLDARLAEAPQKPTILALHHPPFHTHDRLLDSIGLAHAERLAEIVSNHPQVGLVLGGHHHRPVLGRVAHAPAIISPSTAWTFGLALNEGQPFAKRASELKGWTLHIWTDADGFTSHFMGL
jgi:3',5'-cyclic-AMP phosphodiesterase